MVHPKTILPMVVASVATLLLSVGNGLHVALGESHHDWPVFDEMPEDLESVSQYTDEFKQLNDYLVGRVKEAASDRELIDTNWPVFIDFLYRKQAEQPTEADFMGENWPKVRDFLTKALEGEGHVKLAQEENFLKAMYLFKRLPEALQTCDYDSYLTLIANLYACDPELTRVRQIIDYHINGHYTNCAIYYSHDANAVVSRIPAKGRSLVEDVAGGRLYRSVIHSNQIEIFSRDMRTFNVFKTFPIVLETIKKHYVKDRKRFNELIEQAKKGRKADPRIAHLVHMNVWLPCEAFVHDLKDIFAPARLDSFYNDNEETLKERVLAIKQNDAEFIERWFEFRMCSALLHKTEKSVIEEFQNLLAAMEPVPEPKPEGEVDSNHQQESAD